MKTGLRLRGHKAAIIAIFLISSKYFELVLVFWLHLTQYFLCDRHHFYIIVETFANSKAKKHFIVQNFIDF